MIEDMNSSLADIRRLMDDWKIKGDLLLIQDDNNQYEGGKGYKLLPVELIKDNNIKEEIKKSIASLTYEEPSHFRQKYSWLFEKEK